MQVTKILLILMMSIFLISCVSGFDFDNVKEYDKLNRKYTITNAFGLGDKLADIQLITADDYKVIDAGSGVYQLVAEVELSNFKKNYGKAFKKVDLYTAYTLDSIGTRTFKYKYKQGKDWIEFTEVSELPNGKVIIGLFTDVRLGEKVEWIPTWFGEELDEWAVWTEGLISGLTSYYTMNDTANNMTDSLHHYNGTVPFGVTRDGVGHIGDDYSFDGTGDHVNITHDVSNYGNNFTWSIWVNLDVTNQDQYTLQYRDGADFWDLMHLDAKSYRFRVGSDTIFAPAIPTGEYIHFVVMANSTHMKIYMNGTLVNTTTTTGHTPTLTTLFIGRWYDNNLGGTPEFAGDMDEFGFWNRTLTSSEVTSLYNNGNGITYTADTPPVVNLNSPADAKTFLSGVITLNCSGSDSSSDMLNLSIWVDGSLNTTVVNTTAYSNLSLEKELTFAKTWHNWTCDAWDQGNLQDWATANRSLQYIDYIYNQDTDSNVITEGATAVFNLSVNMTNIPSTTAILYYNNSAYNPSTSTSTAHQYYFTRSLAIPDNTGNTTGIGVNWYWTFNITEEANVTTTTQTQTVYAVDIDNCTLYDNEILNFTLRDEESDTRMSVAAQNSKIDLDVTLTSLLDSSLYWTYNISMINNTELRICVPTGILNSSTTNYSLDLTTDFIETTAYVEEFYHLDNFILTYLNTPKYIYLRDLKSADSTTFKIEYRDSGNLLVEDAIVSILRKYVDQAQFKEVENARTNDVGVALLHLVEEDVIYRFNVTLNGQWQYLSDEFRVYCVAGEECLIELGEGITGFPSIPTDWDNLPEGTAEITSNRTTRIITLTFNLDETKLMNMSVYKLSNNQTEADQLITSNSTSLSSGSITTYVPYTYTNSTYVVEIYADNVFIGSQYANLKESAEDYFGTSLNLFMVALMIMTLALMAISSGPGIVIFAVIGVILASILGLLRVGLVLILYLVCASIILIWKISRRAR